MTRFKIEEWTYPVGQKVYRLFQKVGRWPKRYWAFFGEFPSKDAAEFRMRNTLVGGPRRTDYDYYTADGNRELNCW